MHMEKCALFQKKKKKAHAGQCLRGDEGTSHRASGVIKSWRGGRLVEWREHGQMQGHFMAGKKRLLYLEREGRECK